MKYISDSTEKTISYAKEFASKLLGGEVIFLIGELGAGKTHFTKGVAKALGIKMNEVVSPTFIVLKELAGEKLNLIHLDLYRIDEFDKLGFDINEFVDSRNVMLIEWADKFEDELPTADYIVHFSYGEGEDERIISIENKDND